MTLPARKPATYQDLLALPDHVVGEILDGELVVSPRPAPRHSLAGTAAGSDLCGAFYRKRGGPPDKPGGWLILIEPELHLGPQVIVPDLAGWQNTRMPNLPDTAWFEVVPDWVCEILSPSSVRRDRIQKSRIYRQAGVEWLWFIDPAAQTVEALHAETGRWSIIEAFEGADAGARIPPFDAVALDLGRWWEMPAE